MSFEHHTPLFRTDTHSSISTNATAPNLAGPGRNLGLLLDRGGKQVESLLNKFSKGHRFANVATQTSQTLLIGTEIQPSVSTNATAPNLPGPGRNLGLLLDSVGNRIESLLNKYANHVGMGPASVAQEIRLLSRHNELEIGDPRRYLIPPRQLPQQEKKALKKKCKKLLKFVRSTLLSTQVTALEEVATLAIEDSLIRLLFSECNLKCFEPDLLLSSTKTLASIRETATHELWSSVILRSECDPHRRSLENSIFEPNTSFIAARYILSLIRSASDLDHFMFWILNVYVETAIKTWWNVEWSNLSKCLCGFMQVGPGQSTLIGGICRDLVNVDGGKQVVKERHSFAEFIRMFCPLPRVDFAAGSGASDFETNYVKTSDWYLDECAPFYMSILTTLSGSENIREQLSFIQQIDYKTRRLLEDTALLDEICVAYCHLKHFSRSLDDSNLNGQPLAKFLAVNLCSMNRYFKLSMFLDENLDSKPFLFSINLARRVNPTYMRATRRFVSRGFPVMFLLRLIVDGVCRFVATESFESFSRDSEASEMKRNLIRRMFKRYFGRNIDVDILLYYHDQLLTIKVGEADSFDATGHFPIITGYDKSGRALYYAEAYWDRLKSSLSSSVLDGSKTVMFADELGKAQTSNKFTVEVLRYDPTDLLERPASCLEGAMDPTGPLHWRKLWPARDPHFQSLMSDEDYGNLKTTLLPFLDRCAHDANELKKANLEAQNRDHAERTVNLRYFRVLPFAKNRVVYPMSQDEDEIFVDQRKADMQINGTRGNDSHGDEQAGSSFKGEEATK
ncbi:hypothetical protein SCHPADRAFT_945441 [Schizopora paradoxa]|uniref:Uncharacterized protein n=1 Tax=Schizopora paradoxa TaxID=27342 RepID=A0A0H2R630_9AGAM|nr:hypothetical protein SCHPADRAFT_945441 [Schizopora paradoxa]